MFLLVYTLYTGSYVCTREQQIQETSITIMHVYDWSWIGVIVLRIKCHHKSEMLNYSFCSVQLNVDNCVPVYSKSEDRQVKLVIPQNCARRRRSICRFPIEAMRHIGSLLHLIKRRACMPHICYWGDICKYLQSPASRNTTLWRPSKPLTMRFVGIHWTFWK